VYGSGTVYRCYPAAVSCCDSEEAVSVCVHGFQTRSGWGGVPKTKFDSSFAQPQTPRIEDLHCQIFKWQDKNQCKRTTGSLQEYGRSHFPSTFVNTLQRRPSNGMGWLDVLRKHGHLGWVAPGMGPTTWNTSARNRVTTLAESQVSCGLFVRWMAVEMAPTSIVRDASTRKAGADMSAPRGP